MRYSVALEHNGLRIMLLLRLSPLIPFNALDYISGVTSISFRDYALALFAILPGTIMFCMVGATASSLTDTDTSSESQIARRVSLVGGLLFAVVGVSVASYYSKQELDKVNCTFVLLQFFSSQHTNLEIHLSNRNSMIEHRLSTVTIQLHLPSSTKILNLYNNCVKIK